jgi:hypothetical protein
MAFLFVTRRDVGRSRRTSRHGYHGLTSCAGMPLLQCSYSSRSASRLPALDVRGRKAIWPADIHAIESEEGCGIVQVEFTQGYKSLREFDRSHRSTVCALWAGSPAVLAFYLHFVRCFHGGDSGISSSQQWLQLRALIPSLPCWQTGLEGGVFPIEPGTRTFRDPSIQNNCYFRW